MTTKEKIEIMQAWLDGKVIQESLAFDPNPKWFNVKGEPMWTFDKANYRIKPESELRPYKNAEEFLQAQKEHGDMLYNRTNGEYHYPVQVSKGGINVMYENNTIYHTFAELLKSTYNYVWQDGSPCGIVEE